ncbi:MAG: superoxide dismutase [Desulforegulaceae bacterium]|nr:superoxide dismutase [Desulforegulaceae bacterium]
MKNKIRLISSILFVLFFLMACSSEKKEKTIVHSKLNYSTNAFEPYISAKTIKLHHGVHYKNYVEKSNMLIDKFGFNGKSVAVILKKTKNKEKYFSLYNNLGQALNHEIYFNSLSPKPTTPSKQMIEMINKSFGSYENFKKEFIFAGSSHFASGWVWLVKNKDKLEIMTTSNADNPLTQGFVPIFTIDVWEHSYYLDYQNKKSDYMKDITKNLLNWDYADSVCFDLK